MKIKRLNIYKPLRIMFGTKQALFKLSVIIIIISRSCCSIPRYVVREVLTYVKEDSHNNVHSE